MCARYTLNAPVTELERLFETPMPEGVVPRYNIAPSQDVLAVLSGKHGRHAKFVKWGLVPNWAKDPSIGQKLINARSETAPERASFRLAFRKRRCIVPATGFFEWEHRSLADARSDDHDRDAADYTQPALFDASPKRTRTKSAVQKLPFLLQLSDGRPFGMAGLWERWYDAEEQPLDSCTVLTTAPNPVVAKLHDRMPCILHPDDFDEWLDPSIEDPERLSRLLVPVPEEEMRSYPVSTRLNNPRNEDPELLTPVVE